MRDGYTYHVKKDIFEPHEYLVICFNGLPIFKWPTACIPESTHSAMCDKISMLHMMTAQNAAEAARKKIRDALGVE